MTPPATIIKVEQINMWLSNNNKVLGNGDSKEFNWRLYPFAYSSFVPLHVARLRKCQLNEIDFFLTPNILKALIGINIFREGKDEAEGMILLHIKKSFWAKQWTEQWRKFEFHWTWIWQIRLEKPSRNIGMPYGRPKGNWRRFYWRSQMLGTRIYIFLSTLQYNIQ